MFPNGKIVFYPFASHKGNYFADLWMQQKTSQLRLAFVGVPNDNFLGNPDFTEFSEDTSPQR